MFLETCLVHDVYSYKGSYSLKYCHSTAAKVCRHADAVIYYGLGYIRQVTVYHHDSSKM
jgi:hypothetical protein